MRIYDVASEVSSALAWLSYLVQLAWAGKYLTKNKRKFSQPARIMLRRL
jgi:hypothetical protein